MIREITILPVLNGFICKVGCQRVVFESVATLVQNLEAYLKDPIATETRFLRDAVNKMPDQPQCMPTAACDEVAPMSDTGQREAREAVNTVPGGVRGLQPIGQRDVRVSESMRSATR